jgi:hypothetical protein
LHRRAGNGVFGDLDRRFSAPSSLTGDERNG